MFPLDSDTRPETPAEQRRRRAAEGKDRRGLHQVALSLAIIFTGLALLVAADVAGVERRTTTATVVGLVDRNMNRGHECVTQLMTGYGQAQIYTRNFCQYAAWRVGDTAEVEARQMRFTKTVVVRTHGTIFQDAYSMLPQS